MSNEISLSNIRALIIDDNPMDRTVMRKHLEEMGIPYIQEANNGKDGLFRIENSQKVGKPFHLLITDWKMPERDGLKLLKDLRAAEKSKDMAIIMVTAVFDIEKVTEAVTAKVDGYVIKPTDYIKLKDRVLKALEKRGQHLAA